MKPRWPRAIGVQVAKQLVSVLQPCCTRLVVAGSLRRRKPDVGDVELVYIGMSELRKDPCDMFGRTMVNLAEQAIERLQKAGVIKRRLNARGLETYGPKNKLMLHAETGMPVDLFASSEATWWNYLVCRTGPSESNIRICEAARRRGWKWNPYGAGFTKGERIAGTYAEHACHSEAEVFEFVGLPHLTPEERI